MHNARGHTKEDFLSLKMLMRPEDTSTKQNDGNEKSDEEVSEDENAYNHRSSDYVQKSSKASSELPFQCDVCHESFPTRVLLYRHKRNLHKLKRFKCSVCDKHFAYRFVYCTDTNGCNTSIRKFRECSVCLSEYFQLNSIKLCLHPYIFTANRGECICEFTTPVQSLPMILSVQNAIRYTHRGSHCLRT